jgi:GrpB-like predicted nucleotidyltransferase (UPF0157 family)
MNENTPTTEEELRAIVVGELKPLAGPIVIDEYDPEWPHRFEREERRIRAALGDRVLQIEHAGSTSVPGLAAKPIIDIVLVVADTTDEDAYVPALEAAGYMLRIREPDWYEHRLFRERETNVNVHVFSQGCEEVEKMLVFRDWLRENAADRDLYERTKRELVKQKWKYGQNYADAKSAVIAEIIERAGRLRSGPR